jgi:hypothetical protein
MGRRIDNGADRRATAMEESREPISKVLAAEAGAWVTMVRSILDYCLAVEKVPVEVREKLQVYRPNLAEFVATGELFKNLSLSPVQLNQMVLLVREPLDHQDIRRAAKLVGRGERPSPAPFSLLSAMVAARRRS